MNPSLPTLPESNGAHSATRLRRSQAYSGSDEVDLSTVWGILRRRRSSIIGTLVVVLLLGGAFVWLKTPEWRASTLIRVAESERSNVALLDVLARLQEGSEIETEMRILRTRPIAEAVTDQLDLNLVVERPSDVPRAVLFDFVSADTTTPEAQYVISRLGAGGYRLESEEISGPAVEINFSAGQTVEIPGVTFRLNTDAWSETAREAFRGPVRIRTIPFQEAVQILDERLSVERPDREANLIEVAYQGTDRDLVRQIPNAVAQTFIRQRQEVQKTEVRSTVAFLQEQSEVLRGELEAAELELQNFRESRQIVALGTEAEAQVQRLAELQTESTQLDAERTALRNLIQQIDSSGSPDYRRLAAFPTFLNNPAIADILQALTTTDRSRTELLVRTTPLHPDVVSLDRQIQELEGQLGSIGRNYLAALNDQLGSLDAVLRRFVSELEEIPEKEIQFARLERRTRLLSELYTILQTRLKEAEVAEAVEDPAVRVVETAILPDEPVSPRVAPTMLLALLLGVLLGIGIGLLREYLDSRIHSGDNLETLFGLPTIARIPKLALDNGQESRPDVLVTQTAGKSVGAEAFRTLRTNVRFVRAGAGAREMVVTSPGPGEGKSFTAANLATSLAQQGHKTLLIDADLRKSVQHLQFSLDRQPGLSELLTGQASLSEVAYRTSVERLEVIPGGVSPPNPAELLGGSSMEALLTSARSQYDAIVLDSPPMLAVTDAAVLGPKVDGVILVVRAEHTHRDAVSHALAQLRHVGATVLGVVLNDTKADGAGYYYYRSYYGDDRPKSRWRRLLPSRN